VVLTNLAPGFVFVAAARMIKSGEMDLEGLLQCEVVYRVLLETALIMALIDCDFRPSYSDASSKLAEDVLGALQLDKMGVPDLVATDLRTRTLVGMRTHSQEFISFNDITELLARLIVLAGKLHPIAMFPRPLEGRLGLYGHAADVLEERSKDSSLSNSRRGATPVVSLPS
jgi:hypothetical protein